MPKYRQWHTHRRIADLTVIVDLDKPGFGEREIAGLQHLMAG
jgi:hypothetical protein